MPLIACYVYLCDSVNPCQHCHNIRERKNGHMISDWAHAPLRAQYVWFSESEHVALWYVDLSSTSYSCMTCQGACHYMPAAGSND